MSNCNPSQGSLHRKVWCPHPSLCFLGRGWWDWSGVCLSQSLWEGGDSHLRLSWARHLQSNWWQPPCCSGCSVSGTQVTLLKEISCVSGLSVLYYRIITQSQHVLSWKKPTRITYCVQLLALHRTMPRITPCSSELLEKLLELCQVWCYIHDPG